MPEPKDATDITAQANQAILSRDQLDWEDGEDREAAQRGFIARLDPPLISDAEGRPVWDLGQYSFLAEESAPPTVNPSLWRMAQLNMASGLFKVTDGVYQLRGPIPQTWSIAPCSRPWIWARHILTGCSSACASCSPRKHLRLHLHWRIPSLLRSDISQFVLSNTTNCWKRGHDGTQPAA